MSRTKKALTNEELVALIKQGKKQYENILIKNNIKFVYSIAHKFNFPGVELEDRVQDGCIGMINAISNYDATKGKFTTHAGWWIKAAIVREGNKQANMIHVPENVIIEKVKIIKHQATATKERGIILSIEQLSNELAMPVEHVREILGASGSMPSSLDKTLEGGEGETMLVSDVIGGATLESGFDDRIQSLLAFMDELPRTEQEIVSRTIGLNGHNPESFRQLDGQITNDKGQPMAFTTINKYYNEAIEYLQARIAGRQVIYKKNKAVSKDATKRDVIVVISTELGKGIISSDIQLSQISEASLHENVWLLADTPEVTELLNATDVNILRFKQDISLHDIDVAVSETKILLDDMGITLIEEAVTC